MVTWKLPTDLCSTINRLGDLLDARSSRRLLIVFVGVLFARGRRTVASWLRAAGVREDYSDYYYFLDSLGRKVESIAGGVLRHALRVIVPGDRVLLAIDDTPTKRYGPKVQGAGIHHNPTPGPADQKFVYGHVWVTLAWLVRHPLWHCIGLPLRALMYVRQKNMKDLPRKVRGAVKFRTKLQMAVELIEWSAGLLQYAGKDVRVVFDGAYAKRPVLKAAKAKNVVVVSRLRKDAALFDVPKTPRRPARGRPRKYGDRIDLAKRGAHPRGWQSDTFTLYGKAVTKTFKSFAATYPPAGGAIRVVIVRETDDWIAFFTTDTNATPAEVLEAVADRGAIEQDFHDLKEVHGAGQQQLRNYFANLAAYHMNMWMFTLIELWAWARPKVELSNRRASPWDDPDRRPSHADRRNALRRQCLASEFQAATAGQPLARKLRHLIAGLLNLAA